MSSRLFRTCATYKKPAALSVLAPNANHLHFALQVKETKSQQL
jgi:hypothetical protein